MSRYSRQTILTEIGDTGQQRLAKARVLLVGVGGLGCPVLQCLVAAGVGHLHLVDPDHVELSNLQRQVIFNENDVAKLKVNVAQQRMQALNSDCQITVTAAAFSSANAKALLKHADIVVDCCDDLQTKYLLNDYCYWQGKILVSASLLKFKAQLFCYQAPLTPCLRCVFPAAAIMDAPSCHDGGMLGAVASTVGSLQALEVIKLIVACNNNLLGTLLSLDLLTYCMQGYPLQKNPNCPLCAGDDKTTLIYPQKNQQDYSITWPEFKAWQAQQSVELIDVRSPDEHQRNNLGGTNIPLNSLSASLGRLDPQRAYLLYCQTGRRSQQAVALLRCQHFNHVYSLFGGLVAAHS